jgi:hypothetical protein
MFANELNEFSDDDSEPGISAFNEADDVIRKLSSIGKDYSAVRNDIAAFFDKYLWHGNWVGELEFENGLPSLTFYQEDEYDQHMDDDEKPDYDVYAGGHYIVVDK